MHAMPCIQLIYAYISWRYGDYGQLPVSSSRSCSSSGSWLIVSVCTVHMYRHSGVNDKCQYAKCVCVCVRMRMLGMASDHKSLTLICFEFLWITKYK